MLQRTQPTEPFQTTTYAVWSSFRAKYGWGYEVAAIGADREGRGVGQWYRTQAAAERHMAHLQRLAHHSSELGRP